MFIRRLFPSVRIAGTHFGHFLLTYYRSRDSYWYVSGTSNACRGFLYPGVYAHVAATLDGSATRMYIDGEMVAARALGKRPTLPPGPAFLIGGIAANPGAEKTRCAKAAFFLRA